MSAKIAIYREDKRGAVTCHLTISPVHDSHGGVTFGPASCLGAECSAWRWYETHVNSDGPGSDLVPSGDTYGYCGLAGSPAPVRAA